MSGRAKLVVGSIAGAIVLGCGIAIFLYAPHRHGGRAERLPWDTAPPTATARPSAPRGGALPEIAADDGPGAPRPSDALRISSGGGPAALTPEARERLRGEARLWIGELDGHVARRDWDALRQATAAVRRDPALYVDVLAGEAKTPRQALAAGLVFEELLEGGALDDALRERLARALLSSLAGGLASGGGLDGEERDHALRLLSRFPLEEEAEDALLLVVDDPRSTPAARRNALFSLGEVGTLRAIPSIRRALEDPADIDTARVAALAMYRSAQRLQEQALGREVGLLVRPRVATWLGPILASGDEARFQAFVGTAAEVSGKEVEDWLASDCLDAILIHAPVKAAALRWLVSIHATAQLDALSARRGRLGDAALEELLEEAIEALRSGPGGPSGGR